ncbi:MAG: sulfite exporter TauE/SafE family protein [Ideonella sp.]|nr:sulfite exporter TauE/SafE family protein [Ideonella sp.]
MRKLIFFSFVVLGAAIGLFSALHDDWSVKVAMMTIGAVVGTVLGGALTSTGRRERARRSIEPDDAPLEELDRNYWRDKGHPPFMKPPNADPDHHMFDPDRQD